jgi:hypothetical protein
VLEHELEERGQFALVQLHSNKLHDCNFKRADSSYSLPYWDAGEQRAAPQTFTTKADALAWLASAQTDQRRGTWVDPVAGKLTLGT